MEKSIKISVVYHSVTGNTKKVSQQIQQGAKKLDNIEVKCMSIDEIDDSYLERSKAIIFGCPTYYASISYQMKEWFDTKKFNLEGKLGAVFATENFLGGGADMAELTLVGHMLVKGMLIYSGGASKGKPYTHFGHVSIKDGDDSQNERAIVFGERIANKAIELFG